MRNIGQARVEQHLRDLRGFAGTGRRDEHEPIAGTEGFKNLRMDLPDGKGSVQGHCAPTTWTFNQDGGGKAALPLGGYSQAFEATHHLDPRVAVQRSIVAQSCTLLYRILYRRVALCQEIGNSGVWDRSDTLPNTIRRYGRLKICATL